MPLFVFLNAFVSWSCLVLARWSKRGWEDWSSYSYHSMWEFCLFASLQSQELQPHLEKFSFPKCAWDLTIHWAKALLQDIGRKECVCAQWVWLFATPWTVALQAPLSMGFSRQEYWSGLLCPPPENLPNQGLNLHLLHLQVSSLSLVSPGKPMLLYNSYLI